MYSKSFRLFNGTFTFRIWATLIALVMFGTLVALGYWQIQRLHWKEGLLAEIHDQMQLWPVDVGLSVIPPESIAKMDYRPGKASGTFDNAHELYLNSISINGDGGYDLLTPLRLDDGRTLLVNRGWLPYNKKEQATGSLDPATGVGDLEVYRPTGAVHVKGILRLPLDKKPDMRPANDPVKNNWYWVDLQAMASATGVKELMPYVLEADDAPHDGAWPVGGQTRVNLPNHHLQYAITWFWLAFILPFFYFLSNWRMDRPKKAAEPEKPETPETPAEEAKPE